MACGKCYQYECICDIAEMKEQLRVKQMEVELLQFKIAARQNQGSAEQTGAEQLKAEIAAIVERLQRAYAMRESPDVLDCISELRQLSAV